MMVFMAGNETRGGLRGHCWHGTVALATAGRVMAPGPIQNRNVHAPLSEVSFCTGRMLSAVVS